VRRVGGRKKSTELNRTISTVCNTKKSYQLLLLACMIFFTSREKKRFYDFTSINLNQVSLPLDEVPTFFPLNISLQLLLHKVYKVRRDRTDSGRRSTRSSWSCFLRKRSEGHFTFSGIAFVGEKRAKIEPHEVHLFRVSKALYSPPTGMSADRARGSSIKARHYFIY
jgi:hypothetical protein